MKQILRSAPLPVRIILLRPEQGRNVGAVIRAAANFAAESVHLVGASAWNEEEERQARIAAAGAWDVMGGVRLHNNIMEATADCAVLAGTSVRPRRGMGDSLSPERFFKERAADPGITGLLFGPESQGLSRQELALCHAWIQIPTCPDFSSLNLAQAVLLLLYETFQAEASPVNSRSPLEEESPAGIGAQEALLARWNAVWTDSSSGSQGKPEIASAQLRRLLHRAAPTSGDLAMLENLLTRLKKGKP